jgi:hypothetical protein
VIAKVEGEDLSRYFDAGNFMSVHVDRFINKWDAYIELNFDPPFYLCVAEKYKDLPEIGQLFWVLVDTVKEINRIKK